MTERVTKAADEVHLIVFACEAGMGSSLMGANQVRKLVKKAKLEIEVVHAPIHHIPDHADVVLTHKGLAAQAKQKAPLAAVVPFTMFFNDPVVLALVDNLANGRPISSEV